MAVPKRKISKSRRGMRRSHHALEGKSLNVDKASGEVHLPHVAYKGEDGAYYYKGKQITKAKEA